MLGAKPRIRKKKLKPTLIGRGRILIFLSRGLTVKGASQKLLERYHRDRTLEEVHRAYFPSRGPFCLHGMVGRTRTEIGVRFTEIVAQHRTYSETMRERWADPPDRMQLVAGITAAKRAPLRRAHQSELNRERWSDPTERAQLVASITAANQGLSSRAHKSILMHKRWSDPTGRAQLIAATHGPLQRAHRSDLMCKRWKDTEYREKTHEKICAANKTPLARKRSSETGKKYWATWRQAKAFISAEAGWEYTESGLVRVAIVTPDYVDSVHTQELVTGVHESLAGLDPLHRAVLCDMHDIEMDHMPHVIERFASLTESEKAELLREAFDCLRGNKTLQRLSID